MKRFNYKAKEQATGKVIKGSIQAENERVAGKLLVERGFVPEYIKEEEEGLASKLNRVAARDRINFTRQFATLIGAGLPIAQSLRTVSEQTQNKAMKAVVEEILADVEAGKTLSDAFGKHSDIFSNVYLSLIRAGEVSGTLDESLKRIATQEEKDEKMIGSIKGAMVMPIITLATIFAVFLYMMLEVVPQVENLYADLGQTLPGFTMFLVGIKDFILNFWWLAIIILGVLVAGIIQFRKTEPGIRTAAGIKLNIPLFSPLFRMLYMARLTRISQILLATGVSVLDTMNIAGESTNNILVQEQVLDAAEQVQGGKAMSEALKDRDYILPLVNQMAAIGEQSGKMDEMLGKAAQVFEDDLEEKVNAISQAIEPVMMILLAILAGGLVGGILFPIYALVNEIA
ncbi:type II secretion system F family protein [Candidatus Saccharibacteria bacterium]|nr:type II secretion system F family protein [Candidatus Saccharibacteria bacterium]